MSDDALHALRMVIQQMGVEYPFYRLVVYGDWEKPKHADFGSQEALLQALHAALPDLDTSRLCFDPLEKGQGSIVFAREIHLHDRQLGLLGLADDRG